MATRLLFLQQWINPYVHRSSGPITPMEDFVWTSALVFFGLGILGGIIAIGLYIWRAAVAHASRQSPQAQELSNRDLRAQRD